MIVECNYTAKGSQHTNYIHFGEGTNEEMCVGYFTYYPSKVDLAYHVLKICSLHQNSICVSNVTNFTQQKYFVSFKSELPIFPGL